MEKVDLLRRTESPMSMNRWTSFSNEFILKKRRKNWWAPRLFNLKVYDFLEEALQVRLKGFVAIVSNCAARRNDANKDAFKKSHSALEPKQKVQFMYGSADS